MSIYKKLLNLLAGIFLCLTGFGVQAAVSPIPVEDTSQNFLGPVGKVGFATPVTNDTAAGLGLEGGQRQARVDATFGWEISPKERIKLTGEYLRQDIDYTFLTGTVRHWMDQGALGLDYNYSLDAENSDRFLNYLNYIDLSGYYSHAPSVNLDPASVSYLNDADDTIQYTDLRRIAGSNAYGVEPAVVVHPWSGSRISLGVNYDNVRYDNIYTDRVTAEGLGSTLKFSQDLGYNFQLNLLAANRAPFNNFQAGISWTKPLRSADLTVGVLGNYVRGKYSLPDTSYVGASVSYAVQPTQKAACSISNNQKTPLVLWTEKPAVYMPQVLAITDQRLTSSITRCVSPAYNGETSYESDAVNGQVFLPTASYFTGTNLIYSMTAVASSLPPTVSIDSSTGIVSGTASQNFIIFVTARNHCGVVDSGLFEIVIT